MAERRRPRRALLRALLVLSIGGTIVVGVPLSRSSAAPETVIRTTAIPSAALERRGLALAPDGGLEARTRVRTRAVTSCAPIWFDGLAFAWTQDGGRPPSLLVATGERRGALGASMRVDADGGPDRGTDEAGAGSQGSSYVWTGGARCVRVRLDVPAGASVDSLRAVFLNTSGTAAGPGSGPPDVGPSLDGPLAMPFAAAATRRPRIIAREQWGANPKLMNCTPDIAPFLTNAFVHHTAGSNAYSRSQADDVVRGIYAYHTRVRGWCDIGYNFLVDRYGDVFEGRSGGVTNNVIGAAQMGFNSGAFSVSMMGMFSDVAPPVTAVRALERILAWRLDIAHVDPLSRQTMTSGGGSTTRFERGTRVRLHAISGHRDTGLTDCPGGRLYALLPRIRDVVAHTGLPKIYAPRLSLGSIVAGETTTVRMRARGSTILRWSVNVLDAAGTTVASVPAETGDRLDTRWEATVAAPGRYRVIIAATARNGTPARPAELALVVAPEPSPTPSPMPSPTPSPSSTPGPSPSPTPSPT
jgi:hypothetical protein